MFRKPFISADDTQEEKGCICRGCGSQIQSSNCSEQTCSRCGKTMYNAKSEAKWLYPPSARRS